MSINKQYTDWDSIILQLNDGDKGVANIKMMRQDLESMKESHGANRGEIIEMMVEALVEELANKLSADAIS